MIVWLPIGSAFVNKVALPPDSVADPRGVCGVVDVSANVTVPEGVPLPGALAVTVALNVMSWPKPETTITEVVVLSWTTVSVALMKVKV